MTTHDHDLNRPYCWAGRYVACFFAFAALVMAAITALALALWRFA